MHGSKNDSSPAIGQWKRPKLRQATLILPKDGRRVKRNVTFGSLSELSASQRDSQSDERSPLLPEYGSGGWKHVLFRAFERLKEYGVQAWNFGNSKIGRGVFKCSIAYLLGSLATFVPAIATMLGQQDGKHMVATITVYFHPARSKGSMVEAIICAIVAFIYAVIICFSSMGVSIFFGKTLDLVVLGHIIVLIVFCGAGLGFVGWIKQRLGHPLINVASSLTSLAIITVLTKEGAVQAAEFSDDKVVQVMLMIIMGVIITSTVSLLISPTSAKSEMRKDLIQVTDSFGDLLVMITRSFLNGTEEELQQQHFLDASDKYKKVFSSLTKNLKEAKYEHYLQGTEKEYQLLAKLVNCMQRLAQNIGGLRSAANTQFLLLAQPSGADSVTFPNAKHTPTPTSSSFPPAVDHFTSPSEEHSVLASIDEIPEDDGSSKDLHVAQSDADEEDVPFPSFNTASDIFNQFIIQLGPSMV